jgi:hypothetical protein
VPNKAAGSPAGAQVSPACRLCEGCEEYYAVINVLCQTILTPSICFRHFLYHYAYPPPSRWFYGLLGSLGRRHAQTPCDLGLTRPRNVRCHQGHWSWSWPVWPLLEGYRVENPIEQETELGEFLSYIVGGVCVFGLRLSGRTHCVLTLEREPNPPHRVYMINIPPIAYWAL